MRRMILNALLLVAMLALLGFDRALRDETGKRNFEIFPDMARSAAAESYSANALFADGMTMRRPVAGTVVRGHLPLPYGPGEAEAIRAQGLAEAEAMRQEVDQYVEDKFAAFEANLTKTLAAVQKGRDRIRERYTYSGPDQGYER